jgi:hypothetical protein
LAAHVSRVTLTQASTPGATLGSEGALMLGWLATRLGWKAASLAGKLRLIRPDEGQVHAQLCAEAAGLFPSGSLLELRLEAATEGLAVRGAIEREKSEAGAGAAGTWRLEVTCRGETRRLEQRVRLRDRETARLLERTLHRPSHDAALVDAVAWADELRGEELYCA